MRRQPEQSDAGGLRLLSSLLETPLKIGNVIRRRFAISQYLVVRRRARRLAVSALIHLAAFKGSSHVRIAAQVNTHPVNALLHGARHDQRVATVDDPLRDLNGMKIRNLESCIAAIATNTEEHERPANSSNGKANPEQHLIPHDYDLFFSDLQRRGNAERRKSYPGVGSDFPRSKGTGGGTTAQEITNITFPTKDPHQ